MFSCGSLPGMLPHESGVTWKLPWEEMSFVELKRENYGGQERVSTPQIIRQVKAPQMLRSVLPPLVLSDLSLSAYGRCVGD